MRARGNEIAGRMRHEQCTAHNKDTDIDTADACA